MSTERERPRKAIAPKVQIVATTVIARGSTTPRRVPKTRNSSAANTATLAGISTRTSRTIQW